MSQSAGKPVQFLGQDGLPFSLAHLQGRLGVVSTSDYAEVARGNCPLQRIPWSKFGNTATVADTLKDLWNGSGVVPFLSTAAAFTVVSSDNTQDKPGGTGALTVRMALLDEDHNPIMGYATLNGTTPVNVVDEHNDPITNILRVNSFRVATVGTGGVPLGNLSLESGGVTYSRIEAGKNRAANIAYTVPNGFVLYITSVKAAWGYSQNQTHYAKVLTKATQDPQGVCTSGVWFEYTPLIVANSSEEVAMVIPTKICSKVDMTTSILATSAGDGNCIHRGWLEAIT